ncbi:MAG: hypothetical protein ACRYGF_01120 [Janthinobacterium lividum]
MPLYANALTLIRTTLEQIARGEKPQAITIGTLTDVQKDAINHARATRTNHLGLPAPFPPIQAEIVMIGRHLYNSRVVKDGYTIDEVLMQIGNALSERARHIPTVKATLIQDRAGRTNQYGEFVKDEAVLECSAKYPRPELLSVIPKGELSPNERKAKPRGPASSP